MNTTTGKIPYRALKAARYETDVKQDRLGGILAVDCRRHVKTDDGTRLDATDACRKDELHPTIHIQSAERQKEYVVGNHLQDRKRIGH